ncbi:hypothetical protein E3N88_01287 [Mikania micrantha]|uniref:Uncharacterized protein n=1 Tax=Mikania micrantha TaxID=192012 RepID=A0A5N6Q2G2_9ASTR|nr:hypothetical protein E3N88_01287 [Mikania micrantha]
MASMSIEEWKPRRRSTVYVGIWRWKRFHYSKRLIEKEAHEDGCRQIIEAGRAEREELGNHVEKPSEGKNHGLNPGFEPNGGEGLRIPSVSHASGGTRVSRSEIDESILPINHQDN